MSLSLPVIEPRVSSELEKVLNEKGKGEVLSVHMGGIEVQIHAPFISASKECQFHDPAVLYPGEKRRRHTLPMRLGGLQRGFGHLAGKRQGLIYCMSHLHKGTG